jgi:hypothetical protein
VWTWSLHVTAENSRQCSALMPLYRYTRCSCCIDEPSLTQQEHNPFVSRTRSHHNHWTGRDGCSRGDQPNKVLQLVHVNVLQAQILMLNISYVAIKRKYEMLNLAESKPHGLQIILSGQLWQWAGRPRGWSSSPGKMKSSPFRQDWI